MAPSNVSAALRPPGSKRLATVDEIQIQGSAEPLVRLGFLKTQCGPIEVISRVSLVLLDWLLGDLPRLGISAPTREHVVRDVEGCLADKPISRLLVVEKASAPAFSRILSVPATRRPRLSAFLEPLRCPAGPSLPSTPRPGRSPRLPPARV